MTVPKLEVVVGGSWHDFDAFTQTARELALTAGFEAHTSSDLVTLGRLPELGCTTLLLYTCLDEAAGADHRAEELRALTEWVRGGGGLVALHATAVAAKAHPELARLLGGSFLFHPPEQRFRVYPSYEEHAVTEGVQAFELTDELYRLRCTSAEAIHLVAIDRGLAYPLGWSRREGRGRVVYLALGHDARVWQLPEYRKLVVQALRWVSRVSAPGQER